MKLHLPAGVRRKLLACVSSLVSISPTLASAALAGGVLTAVFVPQVMAEYVPGEDISVSGSGNVIEKDIVLDSLLSVSVTQDSEGQGDLTISGKMSSTGENGALKVTGDGELISSGGLEVSGETSIEGAKLTIQGDYSLGAVSVSKGGTLYVEKQQDAYLPSLLKLNQGTLDVGSQSIGSKDNRGSIVLGGTDAENEEAIANGTLSKNVIKGGDAGLIDPESGVYSSISGVGDLTLKRSSATNNYRFNLHNTIQHTGDLTLQGRDIYVGNAANGAALIKNTGDITIDNASSVTVNRATLANSGDIIVKGSLLVAPSAYTEDGGARQFHAKVVNDGNVIINDGGWMRLQQYAELDITGSSAGNGFVYVNDGTLVVSDDATFKAHLVELGDAGHLYVGKASVDTAVYAGSAHIYAGLGVDAVSYTNIGLEQGRLSWQGEGAAVDGAEIRVGSYQTFTVAGVKLTNTHLDVGGTLTLEEFDDAVGIIGEGTSLSVDYFGSVVTSNVPVALTGGKHSVTVGKLTDAGTHGEYTMMSTSQLNGLILSGNANFSVDMSSAVLEYEKDALIGLIFSGLTIDDSTPLTLTEDSLRTYALSKYFTLTGLDGYHIANIETNGENTVLYLSNRPQDAIPEPTTATLSLLGLAALAARRRRK